MKTLKLKYQFAIVFFLSLILIFFLVYHFVLPRSIEPYNQGVFLVLHDQLNDQDYQNLDENFGYIEYKHDEIINNSNNLYQLISTKKINEITKFINENKDLNQGVIPTNNNNKIFFVYRFEQDDTIKILINNSKGRHDDFYFGLSDKTVIIILISFLIPVAFIMIWFTRISKSIKSLKQLISEPNKKMEDMHIASTEIKDLVLAIYQYQKDIEQNEQKKQELFQNISHNLKTPITSIRMYAEGIEDEIYYENDVKKSASIILEETELLTRKVNQIMQLNKLTYLSNLNNDYALLSLEDLFNSTIKRYEKRANSIHFTYETDDSLFRGNLELWQLVIDNILDNCIRFAKTTIHIKIEDRKLTIYNDGKSIENSLLNSMFEPYVKGEKGNFGLGLYIIKKTLEIIGYSIHIENVDQGVTYIII